MSLESKMELIRSATIDIALDWDYEIDKIKISMPEHYICRLRNMMDRSFKIKSNKYETTRMTLFGFDVLPNYENNIVVFHTDMPLNKHIKPIVIEVL